MKTPRFRARLVPVLAVAVALLPGLGWRLRAKESAAREGAWKIIEPEGRPAPLFNLATDLGETKDLAAEKPEVALNESAS